MDNKELTRLLVLSLNQSQKMHEEIVNILGLDITDEKHRLLRVYSEQNKDLLKKIDKMIKQ